MIKIVETRTIQSHSNIDVLHPLIVVFFQFMICMWFPRHMYEDIVLLSKVVFFAMEQGMFVWWKPGQNDENGGNQDNTVKFKY